MTGNRRALGCGALVAAAVAAGASAPAAFAASSAADRGATTITLAGPAAKALRAGDVKITATRPASANAKRIVLPVSRTAKRNGRPLLIHGGSVRLASGRRVVRLTALQTLVGPRASTVSAKVGARRVALFAIASGRGAVTGGSVRARGVTVALTKTGAGALRRGLRIAKLPAGRLGRAVLQARVPPAQTPAAPAPQPPAQPAPGDPAPTPPAPPAPAPQPELCPATPPAVTPVDGIGQTRWKGKTTWIDYVTRFWPGPGPASSGCVLATGGASQVDPADKYGWQYTATSVAGGAGGSVTLEHKGTLEFRAPGHFIATKITDPTFAVAGDRLSATVVADGAASGEMADAMRDGYAAPLPFSRTHLLDLDLSQATVEPDGDVVRYRDVPATVAAGADRILSYPAGTDWGSFTFELPATVLPPVSWRLRKSFVDYMLRQWAAIPPADPNEQFGRVHADGGAVVGTAVGAAELPASSVISFVWSGNRGTGAYARSSQPFVASPDFDYQLDTTEGTAARYQAQLASGSATVNASGETVLQLGGRIGFQMPAHFIDVAFEQPRIVIAADGASARIVTDGHDGGSMECALDPTCENRLNEWDDLHALDLDLGAVTPTSGEAADGTPLTVFTDVPSTITADGARSLNYAAGDPYGHFSFAVPTALLR